MSELLVIDLRVRVDIVVLRANHTGIDLDWSFRKLGQMVADAAHLAIAPLHLLAGNHVLPITPAMLRIPPLFITLASIFDLLHAIEVLHRH